MDPGEEFVRDAPIWREVKTEERLNAIRLPTSYLHHFTPIKLTTELKMLTKVIEPRRLMVIPWALDLDNATTSSLASSLMAKSVIPPTELAEAGREPAIQTVALPESGQTNEWAIETGYFVETAWLAETSKAEKTEAMNLLKVLSSMSMPALSGELRTSGREWLKLLGINQPPVERAPLRAPIRLVFQQLAGAAQREAEELEAALAQFREGLERLVLEPSRAVLVPRPVLTKGAVRTRGTIPHPKETGTIGATILTEAWEAEKKLDLKVERGPQIRRGKLALSLIAPAELVGRIANIVLSTEGMEVLLGSVAIEGTGRGKARIRLKADLESVGVKIEEGTLPLGAFRVFIEPRPLKPEEEGVG